MTAPMEEPKDTGSTTAMRHGGISFYIWRILGMTVAGEGVGSESIDLEGRSCSLIWKGRTRRIRTGRGLAFPLGPTILFPSFSVYHSTVKLRPTVYSRLLVVRIIFTELHFKGPMAVAKTMLVGDCQSRTMAILHCCRIEVVPSYQDVFRFCL